MTPVVKVGQCCSSRSQTQIRDTVNRDHTGNTNSEKETTGPTHAASQLPSLILQVVIFHLPTVQKTASNVEALQRMRTSPPCDVFDTLLVAAVYRSLCWLSIHIYELLSFKKWGYSSSPSLPAHFMLAQWQRGEKKYWNLNELWPKEKKKVSKSFSFSAKKLVGDELIQGFL